MDGQERRIDCKECGFKGIDNIFLDEMVQWYDFQEDFRQMLGEKNSLPQQCRASSRAGSQKAVCTCTMHRGTLTTVLG